jgi:hypothetical protein
VATSASNINTLVTTADLIVDIGTVATSASNINTLVTTADLIVDIGTVVTAIPNINALATTAILNDISTVATDIQAIRDVAGGVLTGVTLQRTNYAIDTQTRRASSIATARFLLTHKNGSTQPEHDYSIFAPSTGTYLVTVHLNMRIETSVGAELRGWVLLRHSSLGTLVQSQLYAPLSTVIQTSDTAYVSISFDQLVTYTNIALDTIHLAIEPSFTNVISFVTLNPGACSVTQLRLSD